MSMNWNGKKPVVDCSKDKGFAVQADREDADINVLISRYERNGTFDRLSIREPFYGDVSDLSGLADSIAQVKRAEELFMEYPAKLRERFENDPVKFVEFFEDESNLKEAIDLGLALKPPLADPEPPAPLAPPAGGRQDA